MNGSGVENLQLLASRGYAVLIPDLPVTPGAPLTSIRARVGEVVRRVGAMGISDSDRLGVFGHSFGGYASTALVTDEQGGFRSAVVSAPVGLDMLSYCGFMDGNAASPFVAWTEDGQSRANANPWSDPSRLLANSPLLQLDHVQAPVLVIQGSADQPRVPQSNELFVGLRRLGKHAEYRFYAGEPHWPGEWGASDAADYLNRTLEWFATTLGQTERDADRVPPPEAICR